MNSSATLERLEKFIPSIRGISAANRQGLSHLLRLLKEEQAARDASDESARSRASRGKRPLAENLEETLKSLLETTPRT